MGILIYLVPAFALWALIATALAFVRGRQLRAESGQLASTQDSLGRYQAALSQLKARAAASALELESLQRSYAVLKQSLDQQEQNAAGQQDAAATEVIPMVMVQRLDIANEIGTLFAHVARVARSLRRYSAYSRGHSAPEPSTARYDLHWLADCLHSFDQIGHALVRGNVAALITACQDLLSMYDHYLKDGSGYNSRDTFQRLSSDVPLSEATNAIRSIIVKATLAQDVRDAVRDDAVAANVG
ncbi:multidrug efflux pump subunit AcrA (membrane-fusion protein) [Xanthomonas arboricola]